MYVFLHVPVPVGRTGAQSETFTTFKRSPRMAASCQLAERTGVQPLTFDYYLNDVWLLVKLLPVV